MRSIQRVILHCSATRDSGDLIGADEIRRWHVEERGWSDIGYHYVIRRSGKLEYGRPEDISGAHTAGENHNSIGVCLIGTYDFTHEQVMTLKKLASMFYVEHGLEADDWFCHYQFSNKDCPNIPVEVLRSLLAESL